MKHRIVIRCEGRSLRDFALKQQISKCITAALAHQGVNTPCEINVLVTDDEGIRAINNAYRKIDKATDVLSFPMLEFDEDGCADAEFDFDGDLVVLGDIVISMERAKAQAEEYGHSFIREIAFLTAHSMLHLLGYDHVNSAEEEKIMFTKQENILQSMGIVRK